MYYNESDCLNDHVGVLEKTGKSDDDDDHDEESNNEEDPKKNSNIMETSANLDAEEEDFKKFPYPNENRSILGILGETGQSDNGIDKENDVDQEESDDDNHDEESDQEESGDYHDEESNNEEDPKKNSNIIETSVNRDVEEEEEEEEEEDDEEEEDFKKFPSPNENRSILGILEETGQSDNEVDNFTKFPSRSIVALNHSLQNILKDENIKDLLRKILKADYLIQKSQSSQNKFGGDLKKIFQTKGFDLRYIGIG